MADPTDYINLNDWLGLNQEGGQAMTDKLNEQVGSHKGAAELALANAGQQQAKGMWNGGSSDLTSYGDYMTAQREGLEAQRLAGLYGTQSGRQEGLRRAYGSASAYDAALTGAPSVDVSGLEGEFGAARQGAANRTQQMHEWRNKNADQMNQQIQTRNKQEAERRRAAALARRKAEIIADVRDGLSRKYNGDRMNYGSSHMVDPSTRSDEDIWNYYQTNQPQRNSGGGGTWTAGQGYYGTANDTTGNMYPQDTIYQKLQAGLIDDY